MDPFRMETGHTISYFIKTFGLLNGRVINIPCNMDFSCRLFRLPTSRIIHLLLWYVPSRRFSFAEILQNSRKFKPTFSRDNSLNVLVSLDHTYLAQCSSELWIINLGGRFLVGHLEIFYFNIFGLPCFNLLYLRLIYFRSVIIFYLRFSVCLWYW